MAKIEHITGFLKSVDTSAKKLVLAIQIRPPEDETADQEYSYDLPDIDDDDFIEMVGKYGSSIVSDGVIKRFTPHRR